MTGNVYNNEQLVNLITQITVEVLKEINPGATSGSLAVPAPKTSCDPNDPDCNGCGHCTALKPTVVDQFVESGVQRISSGPNTPAVSSKYAPYIDHTLLKPNVTPEQLQKICDEARKYSFKSVCVNAANVPFCVEQLQGSGVDVTAVVGFPLGATTGRVKAFETDEAIRNGANEIDMVINVTRLQAKDYGYVFDDIQQVVRAAQGRIVKVILETGLLNKMEKISGCVLSKAAGAQFVKTSTGFGHGGATIEDVTLMREVVGSDIGVKASGGIGDAETAQKMVAAGATRIGASASVAIVQGGKADSSGY